MRASFQYAFQPLMVAAPPPQLSGGRASDLPPNEGPRRMRSHNRRFICATLHTLALSSVPGWLLPGAAIAFVTTTQAATDISTGVRAPKVTPGVVNIPSSRAEPLGLPASRQLTVFLNPAFLKLSKTIAVSSGSVRSTVSTATTATNSRYSCTNRVE